MDFNKSKIDNAIHKAAQSVNLDDYDYCQKLGQQVVDRVQREYFEQDRPVGVEDIQDIVEEVLIKSDRVSMAKSYILYREKRRLVREHRQAHYQSKDIMVTKRDGSQRPYNADMINKAIERACVAVKDPIGKVMQIATETELTLYNGITTEEIDQAIINTAVQNIKDDPDFDTIATRLLLKTIYKGVLGNFYTEDELRQKHQAGFPEYIKKGIEQDLLDKRMPEIYDLEALAAELDLSRDNLFKYIGVATMRKRYMIRDRKHRVMETPQYFWMRVAMGLALNEKESNKVALQFYNKMSQLEYISGGSTLIHAGTILPKLSNCFLMEMNDDIDHIGKTVSDVMKLTKATGGIGLSVTKLRCEGSPIRKTNTFSSGPIPFMHIIDSAIRAVSRAGKKLGALCFYMENWHLDFGQFLDLRQNAGDEYRRTRTANTAVLLSDEFMKRVDNDEDWYLFDPLEVSDLNELYGSAFSKRYNEYIEMAEAGKFRIFKKIKAREQYKAILVSLQTTAHPWLTWKDAINNRALNNNTGTIHLSNLCTEVCLPQDKDNIAVCNLASINLVRHLVGQELDWAKLEKSVRLATRQLDNLVDITVATVPEADNANHQNRAVGLGLMGFSDTVEKLGLSYESDEACNFIDNVMEFISYMAIDESANLAQEKGSYPNFQGSRWSEGYVPYDTLAVVEKERSLELTVDKSSTLDWDKLRAKVKQGMRNATLMAIAPTANIGLVAGTTPSIDPRFAQVFSRSTFSGKFLEINSNLVSDLKKLKLWDKVKDELISKFGDISDMEEVPEEMKAIYKTSFQVDPGAFVEVAARAQKWIDQAISRNIYLSSREITDVMTVYMNAWKKGLKTTYYLHMKPRHQAEQSTTKVNKAKQLGRTGFNGSGKGFGQSVPAPTVIAAKPQPQPVAPSGQQTVQQSASKITSQTQIPAEKELVAVKKAVIRTTVNSCPVDPQERLLCDSCQ